MREPTRPFWLEGLPGQDVGADAPPPARADGVVIGGGIPGASSAHCVGAHGISSVVLEARGLAGGASGRNGGHISPGTAERFSEACKRYGKPRARAIWDFSHRCADAVRAFVAEHGVECELRVTGSVSLALTEPELAQIEDTATSLTALGVAVERWDAATCAARTRSRSFLGGVLRTTAGQLWPARLVLAIAEQAAARGARIHTRTAVVEVARATRGFIVRTDRGDVATPVVVHATNAWARRLVPALEGVIVPVRGQVIVTAPAPPLWTFGLSTNFGYEYWMQRPDGRVVLGGLRWLTPTQEVGTDDDTAIEPHVSAALHAFLPRHFPDLAGVPVEREWTGIMGFTPDRAPLVGPLPGSPGEYVAAGFHGHGMPMAFFAARAVAEMIAGKEPEVFVPEAFLPDRFLRR